MTDLESSLREIVRAVVLEELSRVSTPAVVEYLSTNAAASYADVAAGTIRRWVREGKLYEHRAGRRVRVRRADLDRLLKSPKRAPSADAGIDDLVAARLAKGNR